MKELKPLGKRIRDTIWREQRIPAGVSIAPTKTLSKLGQYATKHLPQIEGVAVLTQAPQWEWLARRVPVNEVWGVGRRLTEALAEIGVHNALDLSQLELGVVSKIGGLPLVRTVMELNGESCIALEQAPAALSDIRPTQFWQPDLIEASSLTPKVMSVMDDINRKYGRQTAVLARQAGNEKFKMKQQMLSPRYLTDWSEIPTMRC